MKIIPITQGPNEIIVQHFAYDLLAFIPTSHFLCVVVMMVCSVFTPLTCLVSHSFTWVNLLSYHR